MTYLTLMNNVLRRLREETVSSVSETTYSTMVSDFINDAKHIVEEASDWSALRDTISINTSASDNTYSLTGGGDSVKVMSVINDTQNCFMHYQTKNWFNEALYISNAVEGAPKYYTFNGLDTNGDTQVLVGPTPDGVYTLRFDVIKRQATLTTDNETLLVPSQPVLHMAIALLARERGETGGTSVTEYFEIANKMLADAISIDAAKHPEEMVFQTV
tara:strand:+ start:213 stop:860 length:648 start_codon:yes stop_codon:yes gene_type:complete